VLQSIKQLKRCRVLSAESQVGVIEGVYFDIDHWIVHSLVVATGGWRCRRKVLISPDTVNFIDSSTRTVALNLTRAQIERRSNLLSDTPRSRRVGAEYQSHYGSLEHWPPRRYWAFGAMPVVASEALTREKVAQFPRAAKAADRPSLQRPLRRSQELIGYHIEATDAAVGRLEDFLVDEATWTTRHIVLRISKGLLSRQVLVSPDWIRSVNGVERKLFVQLCREEIERGPACDPERLPAAECAKAPHPHSSHPE
jgi:hypothetical protein